MTFKLIFISEEYEVFLLFFLAVKEIPLLLFFPFYNLFSARNSRPALADIRKFQAGDVFGANH